jgi:hypothetical protein
MSRGPGRIQQEIAALIAANPDGAWTTADLCRHIYEVKTIEKKHSVAVARALRSMELPPPWKWWNYCLYNTSSRESTKLHIILDGCQNWAGLA